MTASNTRHVPAGYADFARYAFPPNELGYCGPADGRLLDGSAADLARDARAFDGAWPYLDAIAEAAGVADPLDADVVGTYWIGGPLLHEVDADSLLARLRAAFTGQVTGILDQLGAGQALAHHSFHVVAVYPWIRFLDRDPVKPVQVMQDCRIRWGTVESVRGDQVVLASRPLTFIDGTLALGEPVEDLARWRRDGATLMPRPVPGRTVSAHWEWVCGTLSEDQTEALDTATRMTLDLVNAARR
jgi:hypothetical protein